MHLAVYLPLVMPLLAAAAAGPLAGRLPPVAATWLLAGSAVALAAASSAVLGLLALTALVRIPLLAPPGRCPSRSSGTAIRVRPRRGGRRGAAGRRRGRARPGRPGAGRRRSSPQVARPGACPAPVRSW